MTRTMTLPSNKLKLKIITMKPKLSTCEIVTPRLSKHSKGTSLYGSQKSISVGSGDNKQVKSIIGVKRGAEEIIDLRMKKKLKMDRTLYRKCFVIMKKLMTHQCSWPFLQPVDPISLKIPDYFSIISRPMDLGTVKSKLRNNLYTLAEEFNADVRLIFSNAMRYNPPSNKFHHMAKEMDKFFSDQWRFVDSSAAKQHISDDVEKKLQDGERGCCLRIASGWSESLYMKPIVLTQNNEGKSSKDMSCKKAQGQDIKHDVKISNASKMSNSQPVSLCSKSSLHVECDSANATYVNSTHKGSTRCTERMKPKLITVASTGEEIPPISEAQLSPEKALRAAMLKRRFAGTILKVQQQTARPPGEKFEAVRLNEGEMRLERKQQEEKCKVEAQIKASEDRKESERRMQREREREAARKSLQKMQRTVAFDDNISTLTELAHIIGDFSFAGPLRGYGGMYAPSNRFVNGRLKNPLERLGLYLKEEDELIFGDEPALMDCEEGELIF